MKRIIFLLLFAFQTQTASASTVDDNIGNLEWTVEWYLWLGDDNKIIMKNVFTTIVRSNIASLKLSSAELTARVADLEGRLSCPAAPVSSGPDNAQISWDAPTERMSGTPINLDEVGGFFLYYGTDPNNLNVKLKLPDRHAVSYLINGLVSNTDYYFAVSAYDTDGVESGRSNVVMKHIP